MKLEKRGELRRIIGISMLMLLILCMVSYSFTVGSQLQITTSPHSQDHSTISDQYLVWGDDRHTLSYGGDDGFDLYSYDLATGEVNRLTSTIPNYCDPSPCPEELAGASDQVSPSLDGSLLVYSDRSHYTFDSRWTETPDIYLLDIDSNQTSLVSSKTVPQLNPDISEDKVVWWEATPASVVLVDLNTGVETALGNGQHPRIDQDHVVYQGDNDDVYIYTIPTQETTVLTTSANKLNTRWPDVDNGRVVYVDYADPLWQIFLYDTQTGQTRQLTSDGTGNRQRPRIDGNMVTYAVEENGDYDIYAYDLEEEVEQRIAGFENIIDINSVVHGNRISFTSRQSFANDDIYLVNIEHPETQSCGDGICSSGESVDTCFIDCKTGSDCASCSSICALEHAHQFASGPLAPLPNNCNPLKYGNDIDNSVNLVFVPSSFNGDMNFFTQKAQEIYSTFTDYVPFDPSIQQLNAFYVTEENTNIGCYFNCAGIQRLLCCNTAVAKTLSSTCTSGPRQTVVIHNDPEYGGAGYIYSDVATTSIHPSAPRVAVHEVGHSLFNLGDEYTLQYSSTAANSPNCDTNTCSKWSDIMSYNGVNCQANSCASGDYYASETTIMRTLSAQFEEVNERLACCQYKEETGVYPPFCTQYYSVGLGLDQFCNSPQAGSGSRAQEYTYVQNDQGTWQFAYTTQTSSSYTDQKSVSGGSGSISVTITKKDGSQEVVYFDPEEDVEYFEEDDQGGYVKQPRNTLTIVVDEIPENIESITIDDPQDQASLGGITGFATHHIPDEILQAQQTTSTPAAIPKDQGTGYIIELVDEPILKHKESIEGEVATLEKKLRKETEELKQINESDTNVLFKFIQRTLKENQRENTQEELAQEREEVHEKVEDYQDEIHQKKREQKEELQKNAIEDTQVIEEYNDVFNGFYLDITQEEARSLEKLPFVKTVYPNYQIQGGLYDSVPLIKADQIWNLGYTGQGVTIGVIDSGVDYLHPDFGGCFGAGCKVAGGWDFVNNDDDPMDDEGHGTHVAGIAAGNADFTQVLSGYHIIQVTNDGSLSGGLDNSAPKVFGDHITYTKSNHISAFQPYIYHHDLDTGVNQQISQDLGWHPAGYGDLIVWSKWVNNDIGDGDIMLYNLSSGVTRQLTMTPGSTEQHPDIFGNFVVWSTVTYVTTPQGTTIDVSKTNVTILNLGTGEVSHLPLATSKPKIYGDNIAIPNQYDIYLYDLSNQNLSIISTNNDEKNTDVDIYENLVWWIEPNNYVLHDINTGTNTPITIPQFGDSFADPFYHEMYGDWVIGQDSTDIYAYQISTGVTTQLTCEPENYNHMDCSLDQGVVACADVGAVSRDIFAYDVQQSLNNCPEGNPTQGEWVTVTTQSPSGLPGVAPDATIIAYKVLNSNNWGTWADIIAAIERSVDPNQDGDYSDHLDVISVSIVGSGNPDDAPSQAIDNAVANGVVAVVCGGNNGPGAQTITSPGTARDAITVGFTTKSDAINSFSSRGPVVWSGGTLAKPDVVAPGTTICSAQHNGWVPGNQCFDDEHTHAFGCSMATPHVSGLVALLLQKNPDLTPSEVKQIIKESAIDLGLSPEEQGSGRVDAVAALDINDSFPVAVLDSVTYLQPNQILTGKATAVFFENYRLEYGLGENPTSWNLIAQSTTPVENGELATWDTSLLENGEYTVRLSVSDSLGQTIQDSFLAWHWKGWPIQLEERTTDSLVLDIDNDGDTNVIFAAGNALYVYDSPGIISPGWPQVSPVEANIYNRAGFNSPAVGDVDGDGDLEIVASTKRLVGENTYVYAFNTDGSLAPGWPVQADYEFTTPALADLNGDGASEIILGAFKGGAQNNLEYLTVLNGDGTTYPGWPSEHAFSASGFYRKPSVADIDGDNQPEIIAMAWEFPGSYVTWIFAHEADGSTVPGWPIQLPGYFDENLFPIIADLDHDGVVEIIIPRGELPTSQIYVYTPDGTLVSGWPQNLQGIIGGLAVGNVNGDEALELMASSDHGTSLFYVFDHEGNTLSGWPKSFHWVTDPTVGDVDGDGQQEILFGEYTNPIYPEAPGNLYAYNSDGSAVDGFPKTLPRRRATPPTISDFDGDGLVEIIVGSNTILASNTHSVERFDLTSAYNSDNIDWGMYGHDIARTGSVTTSADAQSFTTNSLDGWPIHVTLDNLAGEMISRVRATPLISDIDQDGNQEIVVYNSLESSAPRDDSIMVYDHDGTLRSGWPQQLSANKVMRQHLTTLGDIAGDDRQEIIAIEQPQHIINTEIVAWDPDGNLVNGWPINADIYVADATLSDIIGDEKLEFVAVGHGYIDGLYSNGGYFTGLHVYDGAGNSAPGFPVYPDLTAQGFSRVSIAQEFGQTRLVVTVSSKSNTINSQIAIYDTQGNHLNTFDVPSSHTIYDPAIADLDNDGTSEFIFGVDNQDDTTGSIHAYNLDGSVVPGWPVQTVRRPEYTAVADMNNDGSLDIVSVSSTYVHFTQPPSARVYDNQGNLLPGWPYVFDDFLTPEEKNWQTHQGPAIADVTGDGNKELLVMAGYTDGVYAQGSRLHIIDNQGSELSDSPILHGPSFFSQGNSPIVTDMDSDGTLDVVGLFIDYVNFKSESYLYVHSFPASYEEASIPWPTYRHDAQRSATYPSPSFTPTEAYMYYTLENNDCSVNLTFTTFVGSFTLLAQDQADVCDQTWEINNTINAGSTETIQFTGLSKGSYAIKISGTGTYNLDESHYCAEDAQDPTIALASLPSIISQDTIAHATVTDSRGLSHCEQCLSQDGVCDDEWTTLGVTNSFILGDLSGTCDSVINVSQIPAGLYGFSIRVFDAANRSAQTDLHPLTIDGDLPTLHSLLYPAIIEQNTAFEITVNATDSGGIATVTVLFDGQQYTFDEQNNLYTLLLTSPSQLGTHTLAFSISDESNNTLEVNATLVVEENIDWSVDAPLSLDEQESSHLVLANDDQGNTHLVWEDSHQGGVNLYYSQLNQQGTLIVHQKPITTHIYNSKSPSITIDNQQHIHLAWQDDRDGNKEIYYAQLDTQGNIQISAKRITANTFNSLQPSIFTDEQGHLHLVWLDDRDGAQHLYYRKLDSTGTPLTGSVQVTNQEVISYDGERSSNALELVYQQNNNELHYLALNENGQQLYNQVISTYGQTPSIATSSNTLHVVYVNQNNSISSVTFDSLNYNTAISTVIGDYGTATHPKIAVNDQIVEVVWTDSRLGSDDIYYTKRDLLGNIRKHETKISDNTTQGRVTDLITNPTRIGFTDQRETNLEAYLKIQNPEETLPTISSIQAEDIQEYSAEITWTTDEPATSKVYYGTAQLDRVVEQSTLTTEHSMVLNDLHPSTTYFVEIESQDIWTNKRIENNGGAYYTLTTENTINQPALPSSFYGLVTFINSTPAQNIPVTAHWQDTDNNPRTTITVSLSQQQADDLNDSSLVGYFLFNKGKVLAKPSSVITFTTPGLIDGSSASFTANSGGSSAQITNGPLIIDLLPPKITIHSPQAQTYDTTNITLDYSVNEEISSASFSLNQEDPVDITLLQNTLIPLAVRVGVNTLQLTATDLTGKSSTEELQFTINDLNPPIINVTTTGILSGLSEVEAEAEDYSSGLASCEVCIDTTPLCTTSWQLANHDFGQGDQAGRCWYEWDTQHVTDGQHWITFRATDQAGNTGNAQPTQVEVDNTPPPLVSFIVQPSLTQPTIDLTWEQSTAEDFDHYVIYRSNQPFSVITTQDIIYQELVRQTTSYTDGDVSQLTTYYYAVGVIDQSGNSNPNLQSAQGVVGDFTAPTVTITSPQATDYTSSTLPLEFTVSEPSTSCVFSVNSQQNTSVSSGEVVSVDQGTNTLAVYCTDISSNTGSSTVTFNVDSVPPQPIVGVSAVDQAGDVFLSWNPSLESDLDHYRVYFSTTDFSTIHQATAISLTSENSFTHTDRALDTPYFYAVTGVDTFGNQQESVTPITITLLDTTPPQVTVTSPQAIAYSTSTIPLTYTTDESVETCEYTLNGASYQSVTPTINAAEGQNNILLRCSDTSFNTGTSDPVNFSVDTTPPNVINQLEANQQDGQIAIELDWSAYQPSETINHYTIYRSLSEFTDVQALTPLGSTTENSFVDSTVELEQIYYYAITPTDLLGNENQIVQSVSSVVPDTYSPTLTITSPSSQLYSTTNLTLQFQSSEAVQDCSYTLNGGSAQPTGDGQSIQAFEGVNNLTLLCDDLFNNTGSSSVLFDVDTVPPQQVENLTIIQDQNTIVLSWNPSNDGDFSHYNVYRSSSPEVLVATIGQSFISQYQDSSAQVGTTYQYRVTVVDQAGNEDLLVSTINLTMIDVMPPLVTVSSPQERIYTDTTVALEYSTNEPIQSCEYSLNANPYTPVEPTLQLQEGINTLIVRCTDLAGNTGASSQLTITRDTTAPEPVTGLTATTSKDPLRVELSWDPHPAQDLQQYHIYRSTQPIPDVSSIPPLTTTSLPAYVDTTVASETTYYYAVTGVDNVDNENPLASVVQTTTPDTTPPNPITDLIATTTPDSTSVELSWTASSSDDISHYVIYAETFQFFDSGGFQPFANTSLTTYTLPSLQPETQYWFAVAPVDTSGNRNTQLVQETAIIPSVNPDPITGLQVETIPGENALQLSWNPSDAPDFAHYNIYRSSQDFSSISSMGSGGSGGTDTFVSTGRMISQRTGLAATQLKTGELFLVGGYWSSALFGQHYLSSTEIFTISPDGTSGTSSQGPRMTYKRRHPTATTLQDGRVLVVGGLDHTTRQSTAEIYNPATSSFSTITGESCGQQHHHLFHTATLLDNGKVLIAGGYSNKLEIFDPSTNCFSAGPDMHRSRNGHTATLLDDGRVLIVGGDGAFNAELYHPATNTLTLLEDALQGQHRVHAATKLQDGRVLIAGGRDAGLVGELFDPTTNSFSQTGSLQEIRSLTHGFLLNDGRVMITGGLNQQGDALTSIEIYNPQTETFAHIENALTFERSYHGATQLEDGRIFLAGGGDYGYLSTEILASGGSANRIATIPSRETTTYKDEGLESEEIYYYAVTAQDLEGNEEAEVTSSTGTVADTIPPTITLTQPKAQAYTVNSLVVEYTSDEQVSDCSYSLDDSPPTPLPDPSIIEVEDGNHSIVVHCLDDADNSGQSASVSFLVDTTPPTPISGLSVVPVAGQNSLLLSWTPHSDPGLALYKVYRSQTDFTTVQDLEPIIHTQNSSYLDPQLQSETTYYYGVIAVDEYGNELTTVTTVSATVVDTTPPSITLLSPTSTIYQTPAIPLTFTLSEEVKNCSYQLNQVISSGAASGSTLQAFEGQNTFILECIDLANNLGHTQVTFTVDTTAPLPISDLTLDQLPQENALQLSWSASQATDLKQYNIYRSTDSFTHISNASLIQTTTSISFKDQGLVSEETYWYAVTAVDHLDYENTTVISKNATVADTIPPPPVEGITITSSPDKVELTISWNETTAEDFSVYRIYRSTQSFSSLDSEELLSELTQTTFIDEALEESTRYYYAITAVDEHGNEQQNVTSYVGITLDLTPPTIITYEVGPRITGTVTLSALVEDTGSGLSTDCELCLAQGTICENQWTTEGVELNYTQGETTGMCSYVWDTSTSLRTNYTYLFKITDLNNNTASGTIQHTEVIDSSGLSDATIDLVQGWNLFSLPLQPIDSSITSILSSISGSYNKVFSYDTYSSTWRVFNPQRSIFDQENDLIELYAGNSYWIEMTQPTSLVVTGVDIIQHESLLEPGWNYIGYPYQGSATVEEALASIEGKYSKLYVYDAEQLKWDVYRPQPSVVEPNSLSTLSSGKGYAILITEQTTWKP